MAGSVRGGTTRTDDIEDDTAADDGTRSVRRLQAPLTHCSSAAHSRSARHPGSHRSPLHQYPSGQCSLTTHSGADETTDDDNETLELDCTICLVGPREAGLPSDDEEEGSNSHVVPQTSVQRRHTSAGHT